MPSFEAPLETRTARPLFNDPARVAQGWYWLLESRALRRGRVKPARLMGYDLAVWRGQDGIVRALDAQCPHMGAHLARGRVEGNELRCFFHRWRYDQDGRCTDIPCLPPGAGNRVRTRAWRVREAYGLVWLWLGPADADGEAQFPHVPELGLRDYDCALGNRFHKGCHCNVVMINAIDEQHFHSVHNIPNRLFAMQPQVIAPHHIAFENRSGMPERGFWAWLAPKLYKGGHITYRLDYFNGHTGTVTLGPDALHAYLMFALRPAEDGTCEGRTLVFTRKRRGLKRWLLNPLLLLVSQWVSAYFAHGDTRVFETIRFDLKHPVASDRAIVAFMKHMDRQPFFARKA